MITYLLTNNGWLAEVETNANKISSLPVLQTLRPR